MKLRPANALVQAGEVYPGDTPQLVARPLEPLSLDAEKAGAQGAQNSRAAVVGGASAEGERDAVAPLVQGVEDELARSEARGPPGMALLGGEQGKAGRRGDLNSRPARPEQGIRRAHGPTEGVQRVDLPNLAPAGGGKHPGRALPAVGHGDGVHLGPGDDAWRLLGNETGDLDG